MQKPINYVMGLLFHKDRKETYPFSSALDFLKFHNITVLELKIITEEVKRNFNVRHGTTKEDTMRQFLDALNRKHLKIMQKRLKTINHNLKVNES